MGFVKKVATAATKMQLMNVLCSNCKLMLFNKVKAAKGRKDPQALLPAIKKSMCDKCKQLLGVQMQEIRKGGK